MSVETKSRWMVVGLPIFLLFQYVRWTCYQPFPYLSHTNLSFTNLLSLSALIWFRIEVPDCRILFHGILQLPLRSITDFLLNLIQLIFLFWFLFPMQQPKLMVTAALTSDHSIKNGWPKQPPFTRYHHLDPWLQCQWYCDWRWSVYPTTRNSQCGL